MIPTMPELNERQLPSFRKSLGEWVSDVAHRRRPSGLAYDCSRAYELASGEPVDDRNLYLSLGNLRGLSASVQNLGGYLIGTETSDIKAALRPFNAVIASGAQVEQRVGNLAVRREITVPTAQFLAETDTITEGSQVFGQATAQPKRCSLFLTRTIQLDKQVPELGDFVAESAARSIGTGAERAALQGTGLMGEPTGIFNSSGVQTVTYSGAATWTLALSHIAKSANQNALDANIKFIAHPSVREKWMNLQRFTGASTSLWSDDDTIAGKQAFVTTNCPSTSIVCGDWTLCSFVFWGPLQLTVDPFSNKRSEKIEIVATQYCDVVFVYPNAYTINSGSVTQ